MSRGSDQVEENLPARGRRARLPSAVRHPHFIPWALLVLFTAIYFSSTVGISNSQDGPDYALTRAAVEHRTTRIDAYPQWISPDYARVNGHVFAKRSPGFSLLGVPFYVLALAFHGIATAPYHWQHQGINHDSPTEALTMLFPALCGAATVVLFYLICLQLTRHRTASLLAAICLGLGTLLWRYSISYQRMPLYILLLTLLFYLAINFRPLAARPREVFLIGAILGYTVVTESTAIFVVPIFLAWFVRAIVSSDGSLVRRRRDVLLLGGGAAAGLAVLAAYNLFSFHQLSINLYQAKEDTRWQTYSALFSTPLWPSIALNLFSHGPIPYNALSPVLRNNPAIFIQQSAFWALRSEYDGLFFQSPYFFAAFSGYFFFIRDRRSHALLALAVAAVVLVVMSKLVVFYSANLFDGRYFTPMLPFLSIGLAFMWREILELPRGRLKAVLIAAVGALCCGAVYNGWKYTLTNYGPHVTGDHRFTLDYLHIDWLSTQDWFHHLTLLWINTFPNIYNLPMLGIYGAIAILAYDIGRRLVARLQAGPVPGLPRISKPMDDVA